jgi:methionyl-tRNA synthetase
VYVWFDALINYLSATGFPDQDYERLWPADLHVIGKGITRFHCVIWPAMLLSAQIDLPRQVWAHGYVQWEGTKMSKTAGTAVTLDDAIERHGADALRYFLLREVGFEADGNFSWERFDERYTADLADGLGNLVSRSLAMLVRYRQGVVPAHEPTSLDESARISLDAYTRAMEALDLRGGIEAAWSLVSAANLFVQQRAPWALAKAGNDDELNRVLAALAVVIARLAAMVSPFIPMKAQTIWSLLGMEGNVAALEWSAVVQPEVSGRTVRPPEVLFPKPAAV